MGFAVGETVGPYNITAFIGQGGMATIFKAHQLTLDRDVALKVIHPVLNQDRSFLIRLDREAAIVAKLNHPNIVPVYDYGECEGAHYLVMRYIQGKTLKTIMQEGRLETERILPIAHAIGDALAYAHAHGVLHRDVKPSNIMLDDEGGIYLTDFGLARLSASGESTLSRDMMIGSPQYVSPEQAMSEPIDERSDIYSFGIVLYEMFTGRVPFSEDTPYATVMAQINDPIPPPRSVSSLVPPAVEMVLDKALAKVPSQRYSSVSEMVTALENAVHGPTVTDDREKIPVIVNPFGPAAPPPAGNTAPPSKPLLPVALGTPPPRRWLLIAGSILAIFVIAVLAIALWSSRQQPAAVVNAPTNTPLPTPLVFPSPTLPPTQPVQPTLTLPVAPLPPSATVVVVRPSATAAIAAATGKIAYTVALSELPEQHSIWVANANGTDAHQVVEVAQWGAFSPDGKSLAFIRPMSPDGVYVANADGTNQRRIIGSADTCCVQWSPDSKRLIYFKGSLKQPASGSIYTTNLDGTEITAIGSGYNPTFAPDGNRIAYASCQANTSNCGLYVMDLKTKNPVMITRDNGANPQWSPRGDKLVYQADDGKGHINVFVVNPDGTGVKQLTSGKGNDGQPAWSRDGNYIIWRSDQNGADWAIYAMRSDGSSPRLVVNRVPASILWGRESLSTAP